MKNKNSLSRLYFRFQQFGGIRLLIQYVRMGLLFKSVKQLIYVACDMKTLNKAYADLRTEISQRLQSQFLPILHNSKEKYSKQNLVHERSKKVWFCWFQGIDNAPEVVRICYLNLQKYLIDKEIIVITEESLPNYIELPDCIQEKYLSGVIPYAQYSDIVRLELLIRYGGSWVDSTVLCLGSDYPKEILDCDLFVFQKESNNGQFEGLSNWFITSCTNNQILLILRDLLYEYWKRYNCLVDYFIFHNFFIMIAKEFPIEIGEMPKYPNKYPLMIVERLSEKYNEEIIGGITENCGFLKLTYRLKEEDKLQGTYYSQLMTLYSNNSNTDF